MTRRKRILLSIGLLLAGGAWSRTAIAQVSAKVEAPFPEAGINETIAFDVVVRNVESASVPKIPDIPGCVVKFLGRETFTKIENAKVDTGVRFRYSLVARAPGNVVIPALTVTAKGKDYRTDPVTISILKASTNNVVFAEVSCDAPRLYVGQRVNCTLALWVKPLRTASGPLSIQQMWECVSSPKQNHGPFKMTNAANARRSFNGGPEEAYYRYEWKASTVVENASALPGCDIPIEMDYPRIGRSPLGMEVLVRDRQFSFKPECNLPVILPLPAEGRPAHFNGAVGVFRIETAAKPTQAHVGDPIELTMIITGDGVLDTVAPPALSTNAELAERFRVPDEALAGRMVGDRRVFTQTIRPRAADVREIPTIELHYFDPKRGTYEVSRSSPIPIAVTAGSQLAEVDVVGMNVPTGGKDATTPQAVDGLRGNILDEHKLLSRVEPVRINDLVLVTVVPPSIFVMAWGWSALVTARNGNVAARRRQGAFSAAQRRLDSATQLPPADRSREIAATLGHYLADRLNEPPARFTGRAMIDFLRERNASREVIEQCATLLDQCDQSAYAGGVATDGGQAGAARSCLSKLERETL